MIKISKKNITKKEYMIMSLLLSLLTKEVSLSIPEITPAVFPSLSPGNGGGENLSSSDMFSPVIFTIIRKRTTINARLRAIILALSLDLKSFFLTTALIPLPRI